MTASQNVILELKKLGIELDMPPNKLKSGYGDGVCIVLYSLCTMSLTNKFKFRKATIKDETGGAGFGEDEADDMDEQFEGTADVNDMNMKDMDNDDENEDIDEDLDFGNPGAVKQDPDEMLQQ